MSNVKKQILSSQFQMERDFIKDCILRKEESWKILLKTHLVPLKTPLKSWVYEAGGCYADIEDIFSEFKLKFFINDYKNLKDFVASNKSLGAWLYNGIRYQFRTWLTKDIRRKNRFETIHSWLHLAQDSQGCLELLPNFLESFIETLPDSEKKYMEFSFTLHLTDKEIEQRMNLTPAGVRTKKFRIRNKFSQYTKENFIY